VTLDPLDGSSLLDVNLSVGTILGIWKGTVMQGELVAAAYVVYGPTTTLVFSTGNGVHEYLLQKGHCTLLQENITLKEKGSIYSIGGLRKDWTLAHTAFIAALEENGYKLRYSGGLVPDVHQLLLKGGGIFTYPALADAPAGKLRLFFELCPFAFLVEHAGGLAINGKQRILEISRTTLHQRSPIYLGSKKEVEAAKKYLVGLL
jgi:fructose-1,6-bisphosphatase I